LRFTEGEILTIRSPDDVLMDRQTFGILRADRVRWEWTGSVGPEGEPKRFFLDYVVKGGRCVATTDDERIRYLRRTLEKPAVDIAW
jgi:hypothetical protein